jgi:outer membrane protein TolC
MMNRKISFILFVCLTYFNVFIANAQDTIVMPLDGFYNQVMQNHPVIKQAKLLPDIAKAELRSARGGFDPVFSGEYTNKTSDGKNSYTYFSPQLKIPTLIGVDVKGGYDFSSGNSVNPENSKFNSVTNSFPDYRMYYAGLSLPVLQGLLFDQRRATLRQAQLLQTLAKADQVKIINKILLEAAKDYWDWQQSYEKIKLMRYNVNLAKARLDFISNRIVLGEEKPIDSVEAMIEYKRREVLLIEAELDFRNAGLMLSNFLWDDNVNPLYLKENTIPSDRGTERLNITSDSIGVLVKFAEANHPEIIKLNTKISSLQYDRKLSVEMIKPKLNLDYFPFRSYSNGVSDGVNNIAANNYKFGVTFYSSLFLRKERGKLQMTNYKIRQTEYELQQERRELVNGVYTSNNELINLQQLLVVQEALVRNASMLRDAEVIRFESGESSLFLVNQRERSLIESQAKLVELKAKYAKAKALLQWSAGVKMFD